MNVLPLTRLVGTLLGTVAFLLVAACGTGSNNQIVYVSDKDGDSEIFLLDPKTGKTIQVTDNGSRDLSPRLSPDGRRIVYLSDESGDLEINLVDRKREEVNRLTYNAGLPPSG